MDPIDKKVASDIATTLDRIARILAGLLLPELEDADQATKIGRLKGSGFSNPEIAKMLNTTRNTVGVAVDKVKKSKGKRRRPRSKK